MSDFKFKKYRLLAVLTICLLITTCIPVNSYALCLFQSDYDSDEWTEEKITYDIPEGVNPNWLPLRDVSEHLPITVDWDAATKEIIVKSDLYVNSTNLLKEKRYQIDMLYCYEDLIVVNGVTYCSPRFLTTRLPHVSFRYNGELYYFKGETKTSKLVHGEDAFRKEVLTTMYNIKLALPEDYNLIRSCLTGGIRQKIIKSDMVTYNAYVYPFYNFRNCISSFL